MKLLTSFSIAAAIFSSANAQTWTHTSAPNYPWVSIASSADGAKLVVANLQRIYTSTNSGATWISNSVPAFAWQCVASSVDGSHLVAGSWKNGPIYLSTNSGANWTASSAPNNYWGSVASSADGIKLIAAGTDVGDKRVYISTNAGITWNQTMLTNQYWYAVASSADGSKLVATARGLIYSSTNSGANWISSATSTNGVVAIGNSIAMSADGCNVLAITGGNGSVYRSTNSGGTWSTSSLPLSGTWQSVASSADGVKLVAVNSTGLIYSSTNSGGSWQTNGGVPALGWQSVASSADGNRLAVVSDDNAAGQIWVSRVNSLQPVVLSPPSAGHITVSWVIPSTNCNLQQISDLNGASWVTVTNTPTLVASNLQYQVTLPLSNASGFYRLATP
jgi:hypothetical protein